MEVPLPTTARTTPMEQLHTHSGRRAVPAYFLGRPRAFYAERFGVSDRGRGARPAVTQATTFHSYEGGWLRP